MDYNFMHFMQFHLVLRYAMVALPKTSAAIFRPVMVNMNFWDSESLKHRGSSVKPEPKPKNGAAHT